MKKFEMARAIFKFEQPVQAKKQRLKHNAHPAGIVHHEDIFPNDGPERPIQASLQHLVLVFHGSPRV